MRSEKSPRLYASNEFNNRTASNCSESGVVATISIVTFLGQVAERTWVYDRVERGRGSDGRKLRDARMNANNRRSRKETSRGRQLFWTRHVIGRCRMQRRWPETWPDLSC